MIYLLALNFLAGMIVSFAVGYYLGKEKAEKMYHADLVERNK